MSIQEDSTEEHYASATGSCKSLVIAHIKERSKTKPYDSKITLIMFVGMPSQLHATVNASFDVHSLGVVLERPSEVVVHSLVLLMCCIWGVGMPLSQVTFDLSHAPPSLTLAHLEDPGTITYSVRLEDGLSACEVLVIVWRGIACGCVGTDVIMLLC